MPKGSVTNCTDIGMVVASQHKKMTKVSEVHSLISVPYLISKRFKIESSEALL